MSFKMPDNLSSSDPLFTPGEYTSAATLTVMSFVVATRATFGKEPPVVALKKDYAQAMAPLVTGLTTVKPAAPKGKAAIAKVEL